MKSILALAVPLCLLFVSCWANQDEYLFKKGIQSLSNEVLSYESEFNNGLRLEELKQAVNKIDRGLLGFRGTAKKNLDRIRSLNSNAALGYKDAAGAVFEWCVSANSALSLATGQIPSEDEKKIVWSMVLNTVKSGLTKVSESFKKLESVKQQREDLLRNLKEMSLALDFDLGYLKKEYEHKIEDDIVWLQYMVEDIRIKSNRRNLMFSDHATSCLQNFSKDIPEIRQIQLNNEIKRYFQLARNINEAIHLSATPDFKLNNSMSDLLQGIDRNPKLLESDYVYEGRITPLLQTLSDTCDKLVNKNSLEKPFFSI